MCFPFFAPLTVSACSRLFGVWTVDDVNRGQRLQKQMLATIRLVRPLCAGLTSTNPVPSAHFARDSRAPTKAKQPHPHLAHRPMNTRKTQIALCRNPASYLHRMRSSSRTTCAGLKPPDQARQLLGQHCPPRLVSVVHIRLRPCRRQLPTSR